MDDGGFSLRPAKNWPALADDLRRSLRAGAGRVARLWVEELVPADRRHPPALLLAAELGGYDAGETLDDDRRAEVADDLRRRVAEDCDADPDSVRVAVFAAGEEDDLLRYLRETEPVFGEPRHRVMNLAELAKLYPAPRALPAAQPAHEIQSDPGWSVAGAVVVAAIGFGLMALAWWLVPWLWASLTLMALIAIVAGFLAVSTLFNLPSLSLRRRRELRELPLTLACVVQAFEALWVEKHPDYPEFARFGLVAVYSLDSQRKNDPAYLGWLARRLAWLRDNGAEDPDETRLAQRLEGEADDATSRLPASVTGNDATYWASPLYTRLALPGARLPGDRLLPILLEAGVTPGADPVPMARPWPPELWPLRDRPPWANRPDEPAAGRSDREEPPAG